MLKFVHDAQQFRQSFFRPLQLQQGLLDFRLDGQQICQPQTDGAGFVEINLKVELLHQRVLGELVQNRYKRFVLGQQFARRLFSGKRDLTDHQVILLLSGGADPELSLPPADNAQQTVVRLIKVDNSSLGSNLENVRLLIAFTQPGFHPLADENHTKARLFAHAATHHVRIAGLEDTQRQHAAGEQYGTQRKQGYFFVHVRLFCYIVEMMEEYSKRSFAAPLADGTVVDHDVYTLGDAGPTVVIIQELPGIGVETLDLAHRFADANFRVVLPHLFGPLGRTSMLGNVVRVFCMRREFKLFEKNASSPIVDWLRALCRDQIDRQGSSAVGVIGMCLTGNFAISLMADEHVLAGVASQPSMPLNQQTALHMSAEEVDTARTRLDEHGPMLAMRFADDPLCTADKFRAIDIAFNDGAERVELIELPGKGHSVLTLDFIKRNEVTEPAFARVLDYFERKLKSA